MLVGVWSVSTKALIVCLCLCVGLARRALTCGFAFRWCMSGFYVVVPPPPSRRVVLFLFFLSLGLFPRVSRPALSFWFPGRFGVFMVSFFSLSLSLSLLCASCPPPVVSALICGFADTLGSVVHIVVCLSSFLP